MKINDIVICINDKPLEGNSIAPKVERFLNYTIEDIFECKCGQKHLNVGLELKINYVECYKCRETLPPSNHWCNSIRFE